MSVNSHASAALPQNWPVASWLADAQDVSSGYLLLLGRPVESAQALRAKLGRPLPALTADFLLCEEFAVGVAEPILSGRRVGADRFAAAPSPSLRRWVGRRVLRDVEAVAAARAGTDWTALWRVLASEAAVAATLDRGYGPGAAAGLRQALRLRVEGLSETSSPPRRLADPARAPAVSVVLVQPSAADLLAACDLIDPDLPLRSELVVVTAAERSAGSAWLDALQDGGRAVQEIPATAEGALAAALDAARGEYMLLGSRPPEAETLLAAVHDLVVQDRPEALVSGGWLLIRCDACARALRCAATVDAPAPADLVRAVEASGGRVETVHATAASGIAAG